MNGHVTTIILVGDSGVSYHFDIEVLVLRHSERKRSGTPVCGAECVADVYLVSSKDTGLVLTLVGEVVHILPDGTGQPAVVGSKFHPAGISPFNIGLLTFCEIHAHIFQVARMDLKIIVREPIVLVVMGIILNLYGSHLGKSSLVGGVAENEKVVFHFDIAHHAIGEVGLRPIVCAPSPLCDLVQRTVEGHHIDFLATAIIFKVLVLGIMVAELNLNGRVLNRHRAVMLTLKASEVSHFGVFSVTRAPAVALAIGHCVNVDIVPVISATGVCISAADGLCPCRQQ